MSDDQRDEPQSPRVRTGIEALRRMSQLGLDRPSNVREAVQDGASAARAVMTQGHPRSYPGYRMWAEVTNSLHVLESDWEHECFMGVDLVANHRMGRVIIVVAGDGATGLSRHHPQVRYERGEVITSLVNGGLDNLWDAARGRHQQWEPWFLMHNLDGEERSVPAELSRPTWIAPDGWVTGWVERLIVPSSDDPEHGGRSVETEAPSGPTIEITRRTG